MNKYQEAKSNKDLPIEDSYTQHLSMLCDIKDKRISELVKALDKACKILDEFGYAMPLPYCNNRTKDQWKEWLMKDE